MEKKWVRFAVVYIFLFISLITLFNFVVDPLSYYRFNHERKLFWIDERWQLVGLAKNYDYNTIILGTSMTENFIPSEVDAIFSEAKTLKLSISGSSTYEQNMIAKAAFGTHGIKNAIWGIDYSSLSKKSNDVEEEFPDFLYDGKVYNDIKYLFNITTTKRSVSSILYTFSPKLAKVSDVLIVLKDTPTHDLDYLNLNYSR